MTSPVKPDIATSLIDRIGRSGRLGRELAVRLDIARSTGLAHAFRRFRDERRLARLGDRGAGPYRRIWTDAANELGAELIDLGDGFLELRANGVQTRVEDNLVMLDDAVTLKFGLQKTLVNKLLAGAGLPVPEGLEFEAGDPAPAISFLASGHTPCVVKPVGSNAGYGVTCGIRTESDLLRARLRASRVDHRLMIERQAAGDFYRFLFLDGELLDIVRRRPPHVTGDGDSTIEQLIAAENQRRIARRAEVILWPLHIDLECILTLKAVGLTPSSVLPKGETVAVKTVVNQNGLGDNETVRDGVAPELVDEARRAVGLVGLRLAGVDVITTDLGRPLRASGGVILEVNGPPGFQYHYEVADPANATRVAVPILRALLGSPPSAPRSR